MKRLLPLIVLLPCFLGAQKPVRYRIESKVTASVDMGALLGSLGGGDDMPAELADMMAGLAQPPTTTTALVSISTRDSAGGKLVHVVIDSIVSNLFDALKEVKASLPALMSQMTGSGKGGSIDFFWLKGVPSGHKTSPQMNVEVSHIAAMIPFLIPFIPDSARIGSAWADTVSGVTLPAGELGSVSLKQGRPLTTSWRLTAATSLDGTVDGDESMKLGDVMTTKTVTSGKQHYTLDTDRRVRDGSIERSVAIGSSVGSGGLAVNMKSTQTVTLSRIQD